MDFKAAVLHRPKTPIAIETVTAAALGPDDVLVRMRASSLCHTDLEVIEGELVYPAPIVLGHEAAGVIEEVGSAVTHPRRGDPVVLSWNPHCGHCFYCDDDQPILCETYRGLGPKAVQFNGKTQLSLGGKPVHHMMYVASFAEYCIVPAQSAVVMPRELPFDRACLIGCGVMTGVGGAINIAQIPYGGSAMVIGCGAVGLSAVQGARLAGAASIIAVDLDSRKLALAASLGATHCIDAAENDAVAAAKDLTRGRGVDCVLEAAGDPRAFRLSVEAVRPGGRVVWLGKVNVDREVEFRWGTLMGEKRIVRSSYGGGRPLRDFPWLVHQYLEGRLKLDELITRRIPLEQINGGFDAIRRGETVREVVVFPG